MQATTNVALGKQATQSSTHAPDYGASNAVDGLWEANQQAYWLARGDDRGFTTIFMHTKEEDHPWLLIDMGRTYAVAQVVIYNRDATCVRLFPARAFLLPEGSRAEQLLRPDADKPDDLLDALSYDSAAEQRITRDMANLDKAVPHRITCPSLHGRARYVVVVLEGRGILNLTQVEAWVQGDAADAEREPLSREAQDAYRRLRMLGLSHLTPEAVAELMVAHHGNIAFVIDAVLHAKEADEVAALQAVGTPDSSPAAAAAGPGAQPAVQATAVAAVRDRQAAAMLRQGSEAAETTASVGAAQVKDARKEAGDGLAASQGGAGRGGSFTVAGSIAAEKATAAASGTRVVNVARNKPCWQSSDFDAVAFPACHCVDGVWQAGQRRIRQETRTREGGVKGALAGVGLALGGLGFNLGFDTVFNHTRAEQHAWVMVDLASAFDVEAVCVYNRNDLLERGRLYPSVAMLLPDRAELALTAGLAAAQQLDEVLKLLVPSQGAVLNLLARVQGVSVASQRLTAEMEGADGKVAHRVVCNAVRGRGRYVVLMLEGKNCLHVAQVQAWAHVPLLPTNDGDAPPGGGSAAAAAAAAAPTTAEEAREIVRQIEATRRRTPEEIQQSVKAQYSRPRQGSRSEASGDGNGSSSSSSSRSSKDGGASASGVGHARARAADTLASTEQAKQVGGRALCWCSLASYVGWC